MLSKHYLLILSAALALLTPAAVVLPTGKWEPPPGLALLQTECLCTSEEDMLTS